MVFFIHKAIREEERERERERQFKPRRTCRGRKLLLENVNGHCHRERESEGDRGRETERERGRSDQTRPDKTIQKENNAKSLHNYLLCVLISSSYDSSSPSVSFPFHVLLLSFFQKRRFSARIFDCANKQKKSLRN